MLTGDYHRDWGQFLKMLDPYDSPGFLVFDR